MEFTYNLYTEYPDQGECDFCMDNEIKATRGLSEYSGGPAVVGICLACDVKRYADLKMEEPFCDFCQSEKEFVINVYDITHEDAHLYPLTICAQCIPTLDRERWTTDKPIVNTNLSKEDIMKNSIDTSHEIPHQDLCVGIFNNGTAHNANARDLIEVRVNNGVAYLPERFPYGDNTPGWLNTQILVCGNCLKTLKAKTGKPYPGALRIKYTDTKLQKFKEDNMQDETMQQEEKPTAREIVIDAFSQGTKAWVKHMLGECDPVTCIGTHDDEWFQRHNIDRNDLPEAFDDKQYDLEHTQKEQMKVFEGQPFRTEKFRGGGKVMIERCDHEDCNADHEAALMEVNAIGEICCDDPNCNHWSAWPCLHHVAKKTLEVPGATPGRSQYVHETKTKGRFREWHATIGYANKMIKRLRNEGFGGLARFRVREGEGFWVYWNADHSLDEQFTPKERTITGSPKSPKFGPKKGIKCGKCHEYHATSDDVKKCYGIK
ncbi:MAG: hypothetical protein ACWGQW_02840 [bacterium]